MMNYKSILATIELLAETYPKCFSVYEQRRKPLKVGIHNDLPKYLRLSNNPKVIRAALRSYCGNASYLEASYEGATRIGLDGEPSGVVTPEEAAGAKLRLEQLNEKYKRQRVAKEQAERKANKGRLGLEDLRKAARARRAA